MSQPQLRKQKKKKTLGGEQASLRDAEDQSARRGGAKTRSVYYLYQERNNMM